jgi:hypothetical protein
MRHSAITNSTAQQRARTGVGQVWRSRLLVPQAADVNDVCIALQHRFDWRHVLLGDSDDLRKV